MFPAIPGFKVNRNNLTGEFYEHTCHLHTRPQQLHVFFGANCTTHGFELWAPLAQTRVADCLRLVQQGYISGHATQDKTRERIELERDLGVQRARLAEAPSAANESHQACAAYRAEIRRTLSDRLAQASSHHT
jgi:hypothetical protein